MLLKEITDKKYIDRSFYSLGTVNNIKIFGSQEEELIDAAVKKVSEIDDIMSAFKLNSDVARLNSNSGRGYVTINPDTLELLSRAIEFSRMSSGAFDITIKPLVDLWGIGKKKNFIPSEDEINNIRKLINYKDLIIDNNNCRAALKYPGQAIDFGGIAKGYAADEVKKMLLDNKIRSGLINLGGNILTIGCRPDGEPWQIGIQNPLAPTGQHLGVLSVSNKTIVTSGSNERFFIIDNKRYHHILSPDTGMPVDTPILSVTAVCDSSTDADALTTALFILGPENGQELIKKFHAEVIFITKDLDVFVSKGLKKHFRLIKLEGCACL